MKNDLNLSTGLVATGFPLALRGYDATTYANDAQPHSGKAEFSVVEAGATYYFASQANAAAFKADPRRYLPSFGGFCAYGVSVGKKFDGDPTIFKLIDKRLHLNLNGEIHQAFLADTADAIAKADRTWPSISTKAVAEL
jgi:YHS domain-containing protein